MLSTSSYSKSTLNTFNHFGGNSTYSNDPISYFEDLEDQNDDNAGHIPGSLDDENHCFQVNDGVQYPFFSTGGRRVIAQGNILPPGMAIRHPSLLYARNFAKMIKEFLYVWDTTRDEASQQILATKIRNLWIFHNIFKMWARNAHAKGVMRAHKLKKARIRITILMPGGVSTDVCVSPLVTGMDVVVLALKKRKAVSKALRHSKPKPRDFVLHFEGKSVDDRQTLLDAQVYERSTLVLSHPLPHTRKVR